MFFLFQNVKISIQNYLRKIQKQKKFTSKMLELPDRLGERL